MTRVAVVGSGNMGTVLTGLFLRGGHDVTVYDVDSSKTAALVEKGARAAKTPLEVAQNVEIVLFSIPTYCRVREFLDSEGVLEELKGKGILQFSTGSPQDAREFKKYLDGTGIGYLEGRIKNYPKDVGKPGSRIIYAGDEKLFDDYKPLVAVLSEHCNFVGSDCEAAAILDLAVFPSSYGMIWGLLLGGKLVKEHGYSVPVFGEMVAETVINTLRETIESGYVDLDTGVYRADEGTAATRTWESGAGAVVESLEAKGLDVDIFVGINDLLRKSIENGLGDKTIFSISEFLGKK